MLMPADTVRLPSMRAVFGARAPSEGRVCEREEAAVGKNLDARRPACTGRRRGNLVFYDIVARAKEQPPVEKRVVISPRPVLGHVDCVGVVQLVLRVDIGAKVAEIEPFVSSIVR